MRDILAAVVIAVVTFSTLATASILLPRPVDKVQVVRSTWWEDGSYRVALKVNDKDVKVQGCAPGWPCSVEYVAGQTVR